MWIEIIIVILFIVAIALGGLLFYQNQIQLQPSNDNNLIYPFAVQDGNTTTLKCPSGSVINVIDAWYELYDPDFQCTSNPMDCGPAQDNSGKLVFPSGCSISGLPTGDSPSAGWELNSAGNAYKTDVCQYSSSGLPVSDSTPCVSMNALGYMINVANGENSVTVSGAPYGDFGPSPCDNTAAEEPTMWPVGAPFSSNDPSEPSSISLGYSGYYGHGVYMCVME